MALAMSPPRAHAAVGDDVHVHAGLVEVAHAGTRGVGDGGGLRHADAEHAAGRAGVAGADTDEDADRAGAHEVQCGLVAGAATDDDGDVELADEALEVEGLDRLRNVLGRDDRALDDEQVELGLEHASANCSTRCGVSEAAETTPASLISRIRCAISSGLIGSA